MEPPRSRFWIAVPLAVMAAIQLVSGLPAPEYFAGREGPRLQASVSRVLFAPGELALNLLHFPVFAALCWLWCRSLGPWTASRSRTAALAAAISLAFAVANELTQIAVPTRFASLTDVAVNAAGVTLGLAAFLLPRRGRWS
jgi:hypothetical protein